MASGRSAAEWRELHKPLELQKGARKFSAASALVSAPERAGEAHFIGLEFGPKVQRAACSYLWAWRVGLERHLRQF